MANMSYCRFRNTRADLQECLDVVRSLDYETGEYPKIDNYDGEVNAFKDMVELMFEFLSDYDLIESESDIIPNMEALDMLAEKITAD